MTPEQLNEIEARAAAALAGENILPVLISDVPALVAEVRRLQMIEQAAKVFLEANGPAKYHAFNDLGLTMGYVYEYRL